MPPDPPQAATPPPPPIPPTPPPAGDGAVPAEAKQWAMFAHLSALLGALLTSAVGGWGCFVGPLVIWLVKKDTLPFVDDQGKEALNFNITVGIAMLVLWVVVIMTFGIGIIIAVPLWVIIGIAWLVLTILAGVKANEGVRYRYPFTLRLIK